jgi:hypothetical protein
MTDTLSALQQHQLVILRRLRHGPLTEFELAHEIAEHSAYTDEQVADRLADWLDGLRQEGLIWAGTLSNASEQQILAAALTARGRKLVE